MDTIVALATPEGRSAIAVIRLSGEKSLEILRKLLRKENFTPKPRYASLCKIYEPDAEDLIDEAIIVYFKAPNSFTGEDVVEISCHGSPIVIRRILDACLRLDARIASPGEFSLRALINGKINLSQAEAIRDLIEARTVSAARQSLRQMQGELSSFLQPLRDDLLDVIVVLESALEFVEDDLPEYQAGQIRSKLLEIAMKMEDMISTFKAGKLLREGLRVALVGRPNVGKSSIFNALVGYERAIVTEVAGTTRDSLHESFSIDGVPIWLIDTAGLRETDDLVEKIGVQRTRKVIADVDLIMVVLDCSRDLTDEDKSILEEVKNLPHIVVINKIDIRKENFLDKMNFDKAVEVSAKTGEGIDLLRKSILEPFLENGYVEEKGFLIADARHADLLARAKDEIKKSVDLLDSRASEEIILVGLHNAVRFLGEITGETTAEDVLNRIFSTFCIGK